MLSMAASSSSEASAVAKNIKITTSQQHVQPELNTAAVHHAAAVAAAAATAIQAAQSVTINSAPTGLLLQQSSASASSSALLQPNNNSSSSNSELTNYNCANCDIKFDSESSLRVHLQVSLCCSRIIYMFVILVHTS